jgi:hypothetical protein
MYTFNPKMSCLNKPPVTTISLHTFFNSWQISKKLFLSLRIFAYINSGIDPFDHFIHVMHVVIKQRSILLLIYYQNNFAIDATGRQKILGLCGFFQFESFCHEGAELPFTYQSQTSLQVIR